MFNTTLASAILEQFMAEMQTTGDIARTMPSGYTPAWAEQKWFSLFEGRNEAITFGIIAFVVHQVVYYGRYLPYAICDYIPAMRKYKLQPDKEISDKQWWKCVRSLLVSQIFVQLPMMMFFLPAAKMIGFECSAPFPAWLRVAFQVCVFFAIEDFYHYWAHRLFHYGIFYKRIHKVHHEYTAPFGIAAEYAHPLETAILGQGTIAGPLFFNYFIEQVHITTMLIWIAARLWQTVEAHCGYDFPWSASHWLPFWAGASHHDYHHMAFVDNFASTFRWWDRIFGTDNRYQAYEARRLQKAKTE
ncbi:C-4 sterol methyl oxidase [Coemansia sp. RSA 353]|nr:C-4 sterol methyl oxidase [Coemansia sp. RSA 1591]KAJ2165670.1 C-4 sterol methyl oxidase [Coemansia sp. RSA 560]KAJ2179736.1 C-4 sterol methyl oxidase [Coemansia sp. RSA 532]KAJ2188048.1 C-4 sterol methyl oxidase [Coemansia sp. RSA 522]KAJ2209746.1 C-4 sterol methyl oxidase [Coemansia sp. RSA 520]KAJ2265504.1 C-4 sterol methyl oxidase [Coemansia sp. RSA 371]KAJ2268194.1 C-4 sterol methyl oxidase [Coemansia sp. RSA 370]KAJ2287791.1 C-4 sterol methyl oxidase [Coemansia sp. RSA 353]KAJ24244